MAQKQPERYIGETEKNLSRLREGELHEWITTEEAANISGYHVEYVRELVRERKLVARKFGPVWAVSRESLLAYINKMEELGEKRGRKSRQ